MRTVTDAAWPPLALPEAPASRRASASSYRGLEDRRVLSIVILELALRNVEIFAGNLVTSIARHTAVPGNGFFTNGSATATSHADFDASYQPINGLDGQDTASRYTVQDGDTSPPASEPMPQW